MEYIDTHCHILPGVDDGSPDLRTSIEMARIAVADGIGTIVATPHIIEGYYDGGDREERLDDLRARLSEVGISLNLIAGAEVPMSTCLAGNEELLRSLAIAGGRYLLMETADTTFDQVAQAAYRVRLAGLYPILAHPERTGFVRERPERIAEIIDREAYCQVTASSLEGIFGKTVRKTGMALAGSGMIHLVATDAHSTGKRSPRLSNCHEILSHAIGERATDVIMQENPARVLSGNLLKLPFEGSPRKAGESGRGPLGRFFRRK